MLPTPAIFSQPNWAKVLTRITAGYGIKVRYNSQLVEVDGERRRAVILDNAAGTRETIDYELLHAVPPQSAPAHNWMLLAEFDYELKPKPSFPLIDTMKPRYDMWLLKRYGLRAPAKS
ncbi:hypothetical protein OG994_25750 [Micromonospora globbae]|uniref:Uncharacterized protein n=1 Tax=Micromonospora globbae TaxID=1894969 RepID=A0ABZ1S3N9_9ACTN|nr:hypothetical protein [Micromonospora globbae]